MAEPKEDDDSWMSEAQKKFFRAIEEMHQTVRREKVLNMLENSMTGALSICRMKVAAYEVAVEITKEEIKTQKDQDRLQGLQLVLEMIPLFVQIKELIGIPMAKYVKLGKAKILKDKQREQERINRRHQN